MQQVHSPSPETLALLDEAEVFLLDYNGTLSDDEELCSGLISAVAEDLLGITVSRERYFSEFAGVKEEEIYERLSAETGRSSLTPKALMDEFNRRYLASFTVESTITAEARSFVERTVALGKRVMLVTAASRDVVVPALEISGIGGYFSGIIGLEDVSETKPEPECYLQAVAALDADPARTVAFEDSRTGLSAALGAGLSAVGVLGTLDHDTLSTFTPHLVSGLNPGLLQGA